MPKGLAKTRRKTSVKPEKHSNSNNNNNNNRPKALQNKKLNHKVSFCYLE